MNQFIREFDLLISTSRGLLELRKGVPRVKNFFERGAPSYFYVYGLTWNQEKVFAFSSERPRSSCSNCYCYILNWNLEIEKKIPINCVKNVHQALFYGGYFYVCNTGNNEVSVLDKNLERAVGCFTGKTGADINHLNSAWCEGNTLLVTEMCGKTVKSPRGSLYSCPGHQFVKHFDLPEIGPVHNLIFDTVQGNAVCCASALSGIASIDIGKMSVVNFAELHIDGRKWWTRGLARVNGGIIAGLSCFARREERNSMMSYIALLNRDFTLMDLYPVSDCGAIYDIRLTSAPDTAHNSIPFGGADSSFVM